MNLIESPPRFQIGARVLWTCEEGEDIGASDGPGTVIRVFGEDGWDRTEHCYAVELDSDDLIEAWESELRPEVAR